MFTAILFFILGLILWTVLEYGIHRWLFHGPLASEHQHHHDSPGIPQPIPLWVHAIPIVLLCWLNIPLGLGVLTGLVIYDALHERLHHGTLEWSWLQRLKAEHTHHHKVPTTNFGLTINIWDRVAKTYRSSQNS